MLFNQYKLVNTIWPTMLTALGGQGVKSSVFLLVYYLFSARTRSLDEAAMMDGAGSLRVFFRSQYPCSPR